MIRWCTLALFLLVGISFISSAALAERGVTVAPLDGTQPTPVGPDGLSSPLKAPVACQIGNLNSLAFAVGGWAAAPEQYFLNFDPTEGCAACGIGFNVRSVTWVVRSDGPCEIDLAVGLYGTDFSDPACPIPGPSDCVTPYYTVTLSGAGVWGINIPIDCPCADPQYLYALGIEVLDYRCDTGNVPDIVTDDLPTDCTSWNEFGLGWLDLVAGAGFPGNLALYAEAECCEPAVGVDESSWGRVKGLFRND